MRCCGLPFQIIFTDEYGDGDIQSTHRCCGGTVHIKQAALYTAISALLLCAFNGGCMSFGVYSVNFELDIILLIVNMTTSALIFYALYYEKAVFLVPFIVASIAECVGFFILAIYTLYYTIVYKKQTFYRKFDQMLMVVSIFIGIIIVGWATFVAAKCYHYLKEQSANPNTYGQERCLWR